VTNNIDEIRMDLEIGGTSGEGIREGRSCDILGRLIGII